MEVSSPILKEVINCCLLLVKAKLGEDINNCFSRRGLVESSERNSVISQVRRTDVREFSIGKRLKLPLEIVQIGLSVLQSELLLKVFQTRRP